MALLPPCHLHLYLCHLTRFPNHLSRVCVFHRSPKTTGDLPFSPPTLANPDEPNGDASNNITDKPPTISDEPQVGPPYNLRDCSTIRPDDRYGFPKVNVVDEPSTYKEASSIPKW